MKTITADDITRQVIESMAGFEDDYDIEGIVSEIISEHGLIDIDAIPDQPYWDMVARHDVSGK
jgi:hypothetical protein